MYHVFVVNDNTFKYHLEYMFAGTCASANPDFLIHSKKSKLALQTEAKICSMIADVSRIRKGDKVLFYLTKTKKHEGMFFGTFKVSEAAFFDRNKNNYLAKKLRRILQFRIKIVPDKVYAEGIKERDALDKLEGISHPCEMCWSLIYRKLQAKRGCIMIRDSEATRLIRLIRKKNAGVHLRKKGAFTYDSASHKITIDTQKKDYAGRKYSIDIKPRLITRCNKGKVPEAHLQAYVLQNIDKKPLWDLLGINPKKAVWIGNEVACGFGMQSIDIMTQQGKEETVYINVIELKGGTPDKSIKAQMSKYVEWVYYYIVPLYPDKSVYIRPVIIAKGFARENNRKNFYRIARNCHYR